MNHNDRTATTTTERASSPNKFGKVYGSVRAAIADIPSGASLAVGGFGLCGIPDRLIAALAEAPADELVVVSNNCGTDEHGLGVLLAAGRINRIIASYVGENKEFARQYLAGELQVELTPQGTLAEQLRAGGAGIPAFYTPAGVGTPIAEGGLPWRYHPDGSIAVASPAKETREFAGQTYVLEAAITTDYALVHAKYGDTDGNLVFHQAAGNFNPAAAMAAATTIAQVEYLLDPGQLDPAGVHLPGIFTHRVVPTGPQDKHVEKRTTTPTLRDQQ